MWTLAEPVQWAQEIKKSRFLAYAAPADSLLQAQQFIAAKADAEARHNCWAYRIGAEYRSFDADEPSGTAGRPILAAIDGQQMDQVVVLVTRWFGGIKLGAGGLVRAYGGTAAECLRRALRVPLIARRELAFRIGFEWLGVAHSMIDQFQAIKRSESFDSDGTQLCIEIALDRIADFCVGLRDATRGSVVFLSNDDSTP